MDDPDRLRARARAFFGARVDAYQTDESQRAGADLVRAIELLDVRPGELALDVAAGVGHTALAVAACGARVIAVDLTPGMITRLGVTAQERGCDGVRAVLGDAEALPVASAALDIATCRRAVHHFPRPGAAVREIVRILRRGGRAALVDMAAPDLPSGAALFNDLERARDDSHATAISPTAWRRLVVECGLEIETVEIQPARIPWDSWLSPLVPDGPEDQLARRRVASASPAARATVVDDAKDGPHFLKSRIVMLARRPARGEG